jgi:hypothetical protein
VRDYRTVLVDQFLGENSNNKKEHRFRDRGARGSYFARFY